MKILVLILCELYGTRVNHPLSTKVYPWEVLTANACNQYYADSSSIIKQPLINYFKLYSLKSILINQTAHIDRKRTTEFTIQASGFIKLKWHKCKNKCPRRKYWECINLLSCNTLIIIS